MESPELTVIIPTYNEKKTIYHTIKEITNKLRMTPIPFEILIVDDSSPDGTQEEVSRAIQKQYPVRLVSRTSEPGLSQSVIEGFSKSLGNIIVVTDADLSHDISIIPEMYKEVKSGTDIVIGSRYMAGGEIEEWPIKRHLISFGATFLARLIFPGIKDPVSGFFAVRKDLLKYATLKPRGYKILLEILGRTYWRTVKEIPYTFVNRKEGKSKLGVYTIFDYICQVVDIARTTKRGEREIQKVTNFALVGISGIFVNTFVLAGLKEIANVPLIGASFIAIETAIFTNFVLNDTWTFRETKTSKSWLHRFLSFNGISIGGMIINITILGILVLFGVYYLIANLVGIFAGFGWNFVVNRRMTWN